MGLETVTHISDLVPTNPTSGDPKSEGDNHVRNIKLALKTDFPNITGVVNVTQTDLNSIPNLAPKASPAFTGVPTAPTAAPGSSGTQLATLDYANALALSAALPAQSGNAGKFVTTNGTSASWAYAGISTINATITASSTLSGSYLYVPVAMTALGQAVTLPSALTLSVGGPQYVIDNTKGGYPVGIRDNTGTLIMAVAPGGEALISLKDNSTQSGIWSVTGSNLEPGLITIDSTFSSTYASTVLAPFVALDSNTSIHFAALSSGFAAFVVDNTGKVLTTPVTVSSTASDKPQTAFKIDATHAIVFYSGGAGGTPHNAVVLTLTGSSPSLSLSVGTAASHSVSLAGASDEETFTGAPKIAQLASSLYLSSFASGTNTTVLACSVSGTTVTFGSAANIITASSVTGSTTTYALTATTALVLYKDSTAAIPVWAVVVSVSGTTCTVGTPVGVGINSLTNNPASSCLLSSTKCLVMEDNRGFTVVVAALTISGTTVTAGAATTVESAMGVAPTIYYTAASATRYNPHLWPIGPNTAGLWYLDSSGISRAVVLTESSGTVTAGAILYRSISNAANGSDGCGAVMPQGTGEFPAIRADLYSTGGRRFRTIPHKISGTTITSGQSGPYLDSLPQATDPVGLTTWRLANGDYAVTFNGAAQTVSIPIFRSNGDTIAVRGSIKAPTLLLSSNIGALGAPFSNRLVLMGNTSYQGGTAGTSTNQLRLINVEIAA